MPLFNHRSKNTNCSSFELFVLLVVPDAVLARADDLTLVCSVDAYIGIAFGFSGVYCAADDLGGLQMHGQHDGLLICLFHNSWLIRGNSCSKLTLLQP